MDNKDNIDCIILEDEYYTAFEIKRLIQAYKPAYTVSAILESCGEFQDYIKCGNSVDLIVSDMNLADGSALKIFGAMTTPIPVILLCHEYPENFRLFRLVDFIYKPITCELLYKSLDLFERSHISNSEQINVI